MKEHSRRYPPIKPLAASLRARFRITILLALVVGAVTGLGVAGVEEMINQVTWGKIASSSSWWIIVLPIGGLITATLFLNQTRERTPDTTEEYVRVFHDPNGHVRLRSLPFRLAASIAAIGSGGSMGLEGPSIYIGAAVGDAVERRGRRLMRGDDRKVLLVAGAAAGIAAIFKAPVTGIVFALEVPYRDDLARRALIPAMFAAASSYVVFVSIVGTGTLFPIAATPLRLVDLAGALLVGITCGLGARLFIRVYRGTTRRMRKLPFATRAIVGGGLVAAMGAASIAAFHEPFALGPGYQPILHAANGQIGPWLLVALFGMKVVATSATGGGNGVGGLFFPSVLMGAAIGGAVGHAIPGPASLFAVVGIAAFLGGSYKVPLAGVAFVAEATGAPGYIIPGLIAAAVGYIVSGSSSLSHRQRYRRVVDLDTRLDTPVTDVMSREWVEVPPSVSLRDFASDYALRAKARTVPVVEAGEFLGAISAESLADVSPEEWDDVSVADLMRRDIPTIAPSDNVRHALALMREANVERAPVITGGRIMGMLQAADVLQVEQLLDLVDEAERRGLET